MTKDNNGETSYNGEPAPELQPKDVIKCRECGGLVRRVNNQHLQTNRCMYVGEEGKNTHDWNERPDHPETVAEYKEKYPDAPVMSPKERMNLAEQAASEEADQRKKEMLKRRWRGERMTDIAEALADKYDCAESTIRADYARRGEWLGRVFGIEDTEAMIAEGMAEKKQVRQRLMRIAGRAESENELKTAIQALKAVDSSVEDEMDTQMELSDLATSKTEHHVRVEHDAVRPGDEADAEELAAIDEITGGADEEIIDADFEEVDGDEDGG